MRARTKIRIDGFLLLRRNNKTIVWWRVVSRRCGLPSRCDIFSPHNEWNRNQDLRYLCHDKWFQQNNEHIKRHIYIHSKRLMGHNKMYPRFARQKSIFKIFVRKINMKIKTANCVVCTSGAKCCDKMKNHRISIWLLFLYAARGIFTLSRALKFCDFLIYATDLLRQWTKKRYTNAVGWHL